MSSNAARKADFLQYFFSGLKYFFIILLLTILFAPMVFPNRDLITLIQTQVYNRSGIILDFDDLSFKLIPSLGAKFENLKVDNNRGLKLSADSVSATTSYFNALVTRKPYVSINADGLMDGEVRIKTSAAPKTENVQERYAAQVNLENLNLNKLLDLANLKYQTKGSATGNIDASFDFALQEQPDAEFQLNLKNVIQPNFNINLGDLGEIPMPGFGFKKVALQGRLAAGVLHIDNLTLGEPTDEIFGTIKGRINLNILRRGTGFIPQVGPYNINVDLKIKKSFQQKASLFIGFIDIGKKNIPEGGHYKLNISAQNPAIAPSFSSAH